MTDPAAPAPAVHVPTVAGMAVVAFAVGLAAHEVAHAMVASGHGADPTLISSTDMRGDMSALGPGATAWTAAAGSLANWALALLGLAVLRVSTGPAARTAGWVVAAVNGLIPATYMIASPLLGFGDWTTALARLEAGPVARLAVATVGALLLLVWARVAGSGLERILSVLEAPARPDAASGLARTVWVSGGVLAGLAALLSPLGLGWAIPIAIGSTLGTTWPLLPIAVAAGDRARREPEGGARTVLVAPSRTWIVTGASLGLAFVWFLGRGIAV